MSDSILVYSYQFNFPDKASIELNLEIDSYKTTLLPNNETTPFWAALDFNQCPNCPLSLEKQAVCPDTICCIYWY